MKKYLQKFNIHKKRVFAFMTALIMLFSLSVVHLAATSDDLDEDENGTEVTDVTDTIDTIEDLAELVDIYEDEDEDEPEPDAPAVHLPDGQATDYYAQTEGVALDGLVEREPFNFQFETVYENEYAQLLLDRRNNNIRVQLRTGEYFDTLEMAGQTGNMFIQNLQRSDFNLEIYRSLVGTNAGATFTMDSHSESINRRQVEHTMIDHGVRTYFTLGDAEAVHLTMFPMFMSIERMEEFVLQHMDTMQRTEWLTTYYFLLGDMYVRNWITADAQGNPTSVPIPRLRHMFNMFYTQGTYTFEELAADNLYWDEPEFEPTPLVSMAVEYLLDG
ncbi:MAG: hypothetical protein FWG68_00555, partial [Defluviitaleaceae bacterium]|nr:hypothetical protein [Defluviitaleaceae bacterium]